MFNVDDFLNNIKEEVVDDINNTNIDDQINKINESIEGARLKKMVTQHYINGGDVKGKEDKTAYDTKDKTAYGDMHDQNVFMSEKDQDKKGQYYIDHPDEFKKLSEAEKKKYTKFMQRAAISKGAFKTDAKELKKSGYSGK